MEIVLEGAGPSGEDWGFPQGELGSDTSTAVGWGDIEVRGEEAGFWRQMGKCISRARAGQRWGWGRVQVQGRGQEAEARALRGPSSGPGVPEGRAC